MSITGIFCAFFSLVAVFMDVKWEKVFNFWILGGWVCGVVLHLISGEMYSWRSFIGGTLTPIFLLFPLFIGKMLGTGDIKMFAVLGSVMGVKKIVYCLIASFLVGAVLSVPVLMFRCDARERFSYFFTYLKQVLETRTFPPYLMLGKHPENIHFTIPIFISVLLFCAGGYL